MLALEVGDRPEALELLTRVQNAQNHLQQLYDEVRGYAAPIKLEREHWPLDSVWRQAWQNLAFRRQGRLTHLCEEVDGVDLSLAIDPFRLEQVFRNVFENSLAACRDSVEVRIRCRDELHEGNPVLRVSVRDNGPGLSAEVRRRIFDPFFTTRTKGTGLGMAIARRIIEAHGGHISADPEGPGAEIHFLLPRELP
jgi:signal transduction histidine kinase